MLINPAVVSGSSSSTNNLLMLNLSSSSSSSSYSITTPVPRRHSYHLQLQTSAAAAAAASITTLPTSTPPDSDNITPNRRRLILLRHAQSSWADTSLRDHDRPLSAAGKADAIKVSLKLRQLGWLPDLILSSDAVRTRETLKCMQDTVQEFCVAEVHFIPSFYSIAAMDGQTAEHLQKAICKYAHDETLTVMCMGHNRGWEEAASMFSGTSVELKTCNAALLEASGKSWDEAFLLAGLGGWKLQGIMKPKSSL